MVFIRFLRQITGFLGRLLLHSSPTPVSVCSGGFIEKVPETSSRSRPYVGFGIDETVADALHRSGSFRGPIHVQQLDDVVEVGFRINDRRGVTAVAVCKTGIHAALERRSIVPNVTSWRQVMHVLQLFLFKELEIHMCV